MGDPRKGRGAGGGRVTERGGGGVLGTVTERPQSSRDEPRAVAPPLAGGSPFPWLALGLVLLAALVVRLVGLDHSPHFDEFYHLLGASSLLEDGDLCLYDCVREYDRGAPFTYIVAGAFAVFGQDLLVGRAVSLLAGLLLVAAVFWFGWRTAGPVAAWTGSLLLALTPESIFISQLIRFYAWHALLVFGGGAAIYFAIHADRRRPMPARRALLALGGVLVLLLALQLQITTLVAVACFGTWLLLDPVADWAFREMRRRRWRVVGAAAVVLGLTAVAVVLAVQSGLAADLWHRYRSGNYFMVLADSGIRYYHLFMLQSYPVLYGLFPVAFIIAFWRRTSAALFCASVFLVGLVVHSGGGFKEPRFLFWTFPFFFALWGIALAVVAPPLVDRARRASSEWLGVDAKSQAASLVATLLLAGAVAFVAATSAGYNTTYKMLTLSDAEWPASKPHYRGQTEWQPAVPALRELARDADVVITTAAVKAAWYLDRVDGELYTARLWADRRIQPDFAVDPRLGIPVFRTPEGLARVMRCYPTGLAIIENRAWGREWGVPIETSVFLETHARAVSLPPGSDLRVFRWSRPANQEPCEAPPLEASGPPWALG